MFIILWQSLFLLSGVAVTYLIATKSYRTGLKLTISTTLIFYLVSTKFLALILIEPLLVTPNKKSAPIIVVLGSSNESERILKGLSLAYERKIPVIFSASKKTSVNLIKKFNDIDVIFEKNSTTTFENALYTTKLLKYMDIKCIYLVTFQEHLFRATRTFEKLGIQITPISSRDIDSNINFKYFLPKSKYFDQNSRIVYEYIAILYYNLTNKI